MVILVDIFDLVPPQLAIVLQAALELVDVFGYGRGGGLPVRLEPYLVFESQGEVDSSGTQVRKCSDLPIVLTCPAYK